MGAEGIASSGGKGRPQGALWFFEADTALAFALAAWLNWERLALSAPPMGPARPFRGERALAMPPPCRNPLDPLPWDVREKYSEALGSQALENP